MRRCNLYASMAALILVTLLSGCQCGAREPEATPTPKNTPVPTATPISTRTPVPSPTAPPTFTPTRLTATPLERGRLPQHAVQQSDPGQSGAVVAPVVK